MGPKYESTPLNDVAPQKLADEGALSSPHAAPAPQPAVSERDMAPARSAASLWRPLDRFVADEARLGAWAARRPATAFVYEFLRFGVKEAWACLFGALMLALLAGTYLWYPREATLTRYDFLVLASVAVQVALIALRFETLEEAKVILAFHIVGTTMEVYKTATGSWIYPEPSLLRIGGVPLFTGFMYAAIGSYMVRAWRLFDFRFAHHPPMWAVIGLAAAIYLNFFLDHFGFDGRLWLFAASLLVFGRGWIYFKPWRMHRRMPILVANGLCALFIWFAENIGTFVRAWSYPTQMHGWSMVGFGKFGSWFLLLIISYAIVAATLRPRPYKAREDA
jgi:uncharacterized membrane protein YoaT (DUF817 family)